MTRILVTIDTATGEVINRDGSVAGKVVPLMATADMIHAYDASTITTFWRNMLAASKVDLSGAEVKVGWQTIDTAPRADTVLAAGNSAGHNTAIQSILDQIPQEAMTTPITDRSVIKMLSSLQSGTQDVMPAEVSRQIEDCANELAEALGAYACNCITCARQVNAVLARFETLRNEKT